MLPDALRPAVRVARDQMRRAAGRWPGVKRAMDRVATELREAVVAADDPEGTYGGSYFGAGRDPNDRAFLSGYERYDRDTSNADKAAFLVWSAFPTGRHLDVGCATGFVVEALREIGFDAEGVDVSHYAIEHAAHGARGHIRQANLLRGLPFPGEAFDSVTALETLEHLPPPDIPRVLRELRRVCRGYLLATIPSFGVNDNGPDGWFQVKVRDDRVAHYEALGPDFEGPIPYDDLYRDARGEPIEGHLTIASYRWWTKRFAEAGFVRLDDVERALHRDLAAMGLSDFWNLYVFRSDGASPPPAPLRTAVERGDLGARWRLTIAHDPGLPEMGST